MVWITRSPGTSRRLFDLLLGRCAERVGADGQLLGDVPAAEHLDRVAPLGEPGGAQRLRRDLGAFLEAVSRSATLMGWVCVRKFSKGIDFFMCGPRSLRMRMWTGFWPPS